MNARLSQFIGSLSERFWIVPGFMVLLGIAAAIVALNIDRADVLPTWLTDGWLYNGGGTGARTLLGTIASSAIGVAGTVFSITIAALSLAAGQMGPRLLRNFTRDRGVQITFGAFIGTFAYALMVLRSVRTQDEGAFTPHLALTVAVTLALACVGTLIYFISHMASRINVDTVVHLVSDDVRESMRAIVVSKQQQAAPPVASWRDAIAINDLRHGYLQKIDEERLANWAKGKNTAIRLLVRRGDYVFPGAPVALITRDVPDAHAAIVDATALGETRGSTGDAEHAVRQLVEVAVRALSPGINDPNTAMSVLDRLGGTLCDLAGCHLPTGVHMRAGDVALVVPSIGYKGLLNVMFHMIRQNASSNAPVLIRILDVLTAVISCESSAARRLDLADHAKLVRVDAEREIANSSDLADVIGRYETFVRMMRNGPLGAIGAINL